MSKLTITVLKSSQYNRLHKKHPQIKQKDLRNSYGLTIPKESKIYIRDTKDYKKNKQVIEHELQELTTSNSAHEVNGIRYGFGSWFKKTFIPESQGSIGGLIGSGLAIGLAPFTGGASLAYLPLAGTVGGAIGGYQDEGSVKGVLSGALKGYAGAGALSGIGGALAGGLSGAQAGTGILKGIGTGAISGLKNYVATPLIPGVGWTAPAGLLGITGGTALGTTVAPTSLGTSLATGTTLYGGAAPSTGYMAGGIGAKSLATPGVASNILYGGAAPGISAGAGITAGGGIPGIQAKTATGQSLLQRIGQTIFGTGEGGGLLGGGKAGMLGTAMMVGSQLAGGMVEPPVPKYTPEEYVARAKETISKYNLQALPEYAQAEVAEMVNIPISGPELEAKVNDAFAVQDQQLEISRKDQIQAINQRYSEAGATGDTQQATDIARVNRYIDEVKAISRAETRATVLAQAYDVKKSALTTVMQAGEFDSNLAYQLAGMIGKEDELRNAIEAEDYAQFQEAMSSIFSSGMQTVLESIMRQQFPEQFTLSNNTERGFL